MPRGFTLLIAVVLSSVVVTVGLALSDIAYKQVILSSTAKQSQYAFYAADSALECALYYDQEFDAFGTNPDGLTSVTCNGQSIPFASSGTAPKVTTFSVPCAGGGNEASVTVYKNDVTEPANKLYASGYNSCSSSDPRRIERGLKVVYEGTAAPSYAEGTYYSQGVYYSQGTYYSEGSYYSEGYYYGEGYYQSYYQGYYQSYYQGYYQSYYQSYYQGYYYSEGYYQSYYQSYYQGYYYSEGYYQGYYYSEGYYYTEGYYQSYYYSEGIYQPYYK